MQPARLFDLTAEAGKTDPADTVTTARLAAATDALAAELDAAHAYYLASTVDPASVTDGTALTLATTQSDRTAWDALHISS